MIKLTLVIPCYNEENNLPILIKNLSKLNKNINFLIIDNGSSDNSTTYLRENEKKLNKNISILYIENNEGYGAGVYEGLISITDTDYIGWLHGDLQFEFEKINDLYRRLNELSKKHNKIFFKGIRTGRSLVERFISLIMGIIASIILKYKFREINAQPTVFSIELMSHFESPPKDFKFDTYVYWLAMKEGYTLIRDKINFPKREYGSSAWNFGIKSRLKFSFNLIKYFTKLKKH